MQPPRIRTFLLELSLKLLSPQENTESLFNFSTCPQNVFHSYVCFILYPGSIQCSCIYIWFQVSLISSFTTFTPFSFCFLKTPGQFSCTVSQLLLLLVFPHVCSQIGHFCQEHCTGGVSSHLAVCSVCQCLPGLRLPSQAVWISEPGSA